MQKSNTLVVVQRDTQLCSIYWFLVTNGELRGNWHKISTCFQNIQLYLLDICIPISELEIFLKIWKIMVNWAHTQTQEIPQIPSILLEYRRIRQIFNSETLFYGFQELPSRQWEFFKHLHQISRYCKKCLKAIFLDIQGSFYFWKKNVKVLQ